MNNQLTIKSKVYDLAYSDKAGSVRNSTTDGATRPHTLQVKHRDAIDSKTKLPIIESLLRLDMTVLDTGGTNPALQPISASVVVRRGTGLNAPSTAALELLVDSVVQVLAGTGADASALNLKDNIFVNKEQ